MNKPKMDGVWLNPIENLKDDQLARSTSSIMLVQSRLNVLERRGCVVILKVLKPDTVEL
ncbi:hypothetical protein [Salinivibrio sp. SS2]|uniref:hypothetical protein n=1 Tax=Salinivibrio sp. SS2 TaxID=1892894 RepID=UPI001586DB77|nr:hypothetical protein [Salinivibrio sp. DV]